jgi:hypothetical protein
MRIVSLQLIFFMAFTHIAWAGFIPTGDVVFQQNINPERVEILDLLERKDVREKLLEYGLTPKEAKMRVAALSDGEVEKLKGQLDSIPTGEGAVGAVIAALLIVFLVLLFTDIIGETDVFDFDDK